MPEESFEKTRLPYVRVAGNPQPFLPVISRGRHLRRERNPKRSVKQIGFTLRFFFVRSRAAAKTHISFRKLL